MTRTPVNESMLTALVKEKMAAILRRPKYRWPAEHLPYQRDDHGLPLIKLAMGTCPSQFDLWHDIRGPATVGSYPASLEEVWDLYETQVQTHIRWDDDDTYQFSVPRFADFPHAAVVSVMLVASPDQLEAQARLLDEDQLGSADDYTTAWGCLSDLLEETLSHTAMTLYSPSLVSIPMIGPTLTCLTQEIIPAYHKGDRHGSNKGGNWPQKSAAFMTGLGQFGVSRLVFRDEMVDGEVKRYFGQIRSLVLFSSDDDLTGSVELEDPDHRQRLLRLAQWEDALTGDEDVRFCRFQKGCSACIRACPSGALPHSVPTAAPRRTRSAGGWPGRRRP